MPRGKPPTPTAILIAQGTFRSDGHGLRVDAPGLALSAAMTPSQLSEEEQAKRKLEIAAMRERLCNQSDPPDPGPRSGGSARRIRW